MRTDTNVVCGELPAIEVRELSVSYGPVRNPVVALTDLSIALNEREFVAIVGPSGCGKTTLLRVIAGFLRPSAGQILVRGVPISGPGQDRGVVFQRDALFPWCTVMENALFGQRLRSLPKEDRIRTVTEYLKRVGLEEFKDHYPHELSQGMRQRSGLVRAIANEPDFLLMDEPFGSLDALTRVECQSLLASLCADAQWAVLLITHDVEEALLLADRIVLLSQRPGTVRAVFEVPFSRPRDFRVRDSTEFLTIKKEILGAIGT